MPVRSQAQRRFMYAAAEGVAPSVGREFVNSSKGVEGLPARVKPKAKVKHRSPFAKA
jgi:hypothetical protein